MFMSRYTSAFAVKRLRRKAKIKLQTSATPVSYTHLDVYKRQVVYNPFRTELLLRAEDCGVTAAGGFEMLVAQAVFATEHFLSLIHI